MASVRRPAPPRLRLGNRSQSSLAEGPTSPSRRTRSKNEDDDEAAADDRAMLEPASPYSMTNDEDAAGQHDLGSPIPPVPPLPAHFRHLSGDVPTMTSRVTPHLLLSRLETLLQAKSQEIQVVGQLGSSLLEQQAHLESAIADLEDMGALARTAADQHHLHGEGAAGSDDEGEPVADEVKQRVEALDEELRKWQEANDQLWSKAKDGHHTESLSRPVSPAAERGRASSRPPTGPQTAADDRRARNANHRANDLAFAADIGQSLLDEVRRLQALLSEKESHLKELNEEREGLWERNEGLQEKVKAVESTVDALKEENWNLELASQDATSKLAESEADRVKLDSERNRVTKLLATAQQQAETNRSELDRVSNALVEERNKFETSLAQLRKNNAGLMRERSDLQGAVDGLKGQLDGARAKSDMRRAVSGASAISAFAAAGSSADGARPEGAEDDDGDESAAAAQRRKALNQGLLDVSDLFTDSEGDSFGDSPAKQRGAGSNVGQANEIDALRTALAHSQRTIATLRTALAKDKEDRLRRKRGADQKGSDLDDEDDDDAVSEEVDENDDEAGMLGAANAVRRHRARGKRARLGAPQRSLFRASPSKLSREVGSDPESDGEVQDESMYEHRAEDDEDNDEDRRRDSGTVEPDRLSASMFSVASGGTGPLPLDLASELAQKTFTDAATMTDPIAPVPPTVVERVVEVEKRVEVPVEVERRVEVPVEVEKRVEVPVEVIVEKRVEVFVDRPVEVVVEKRVEVPVEVEKVVEKIVHVPVETTVEKIVEVEKRVEVPVDRVVEVPVDRVVDNRIEVPVDRVVEVERIVEKRVEVPKIVEKIVEKVVEVPVERVVEKVVEVPVDRVVERVVEKLVEVPVEKRIEVPVEKRVEVRVEKIVYVDRFIETKTPKPTTHSGTQTAVERRVEQSLQTDVRPARTSSLHARTTSASTTHHGPGDLESEAEMYSADEGGQTDFEDFEDARELPDSTGGLQTRGGAKRHVGVHAGTQTSPGAVPDSKRISVATFGPRRRSASAASSERSEAETTIQEPGPRYLQVIGERGLSPEPSERPESSASMYSMTTDTTYQAPRKVVIDKSKPPVFTIPPPPVVPPPRHLTPVKADSKPSRPTSPMPPEFLQRAGQTPSTFRQRSLHDASRRTSYASMPPPSTVEAMPVDRPGLPLKSRRSFATVDWAESMSQFGAVEPSPDRVTPTRKSTFRRPRADTATAMGRQSSRSTGAASIRSRRQSFASECTSEGGDLPRPPSPSAGVGTSTDPAVIHAITQTMIGEFLHKYTTKTMTKVFSGKRHRRFFWVHPYTKTLYWSTADPGAAATNQSSAKSVFIEAVEEVDDVNVNPPGLATQSILIRTPNRLMKITAPTRERHELWFNAIKYLLSRPEGSPVTAAGTTPPRPLATPSASTRAARLQSEDRRSTFSTPPAIRSAIYGSQRSALRSLERPTLRGRGNGSASTVKRADTAAAEFLRQGTSLGSMAFRKPSDSADSSVDFVDPSEAPSAGDEDESGAYEGLENVRACCDGKHDVGALTRHLHHHHHHQHTHHQAPESVASVRKPLTSRPSAVSADTSLGEFGSVGSAASQLASLRSRLGAVSPTPSHKRPSTPASALRPKVAGNSDYWHGLGSYGGDVERAPPSRSISRLSNRS